MSGLQTERRPVGHWAGIASLWAQVGPPLRPSRQDLRFVEDAVGRLAGSGSTLRGLILGVTPELYRLSWPKGTEVSAVDHTQAMIDEIWPGPSENAYLAEWTNLPLAPASHDVVLCDGGLHLLRYPNDTRDLVRELVRVVRPGGLCILRLFVPPKNREAVHDILEDLHAGRIANLNLLKFRLWMALHESPNTGVELGNVWQVINKSAPDLGLLARRIGWANEHMMVINTYRESRNRYFFLTLDDVRALFCKDPGGFEGESMHVPGYEFGDQCPTLVLRRTTTGKSQ